jgi:hypothetical protein
LAGMLSLKPEDEKRLHPEALKWFNARRAEIQFEVPLEELSDDDLNAFLQDDEKREFQSCMEEISKGLSKCIYSDGTSPDPFVNAKAGLTVLLFELNSWTPMRRIGLLLKNVHQRKVAKAKQERRERDEEEKRSQEQAEAERRRKEEAVEAERRKNEAEERWWAAYKELNIPADDAFRYLKSEEHQEFVDSIPAGVDAYLAKGKSYVLDRRANDYLVWISVINNRRKKEREKITATLVAQEYNEHLNKEIARLKSVLCPSKKDLNDWFKKKIKDKRYSGHNFDYVLSADEKGIFDVTLVSVANKKLEQLVTNDLRQFIDVPSQYRRIYFPLPSAEYSLEGVPCLDFMFDVYAVVEIRVWLKPGQKKFGDYIFDLPWRGGKGYSVLLQEPKFLGYYYLVLTPEDLGGYVFWQSIPLLLLRGLLGGETKPSGFTISATSDTAFTYKIPKFKEEVTIPDSFAGYLKSVGGIDEMANMGIMTEKVTGVFKSELSELKEHEALSLKGRDKGKDTKKARAFRFFSEGKGPSSPEVKALGLHKSTRFKYYNQYQAVYKP